MSPAPSLPSPLLPAAARLSQGWKADKFCAGTKESGRIGGETGNCLGWGFSSVVLKYEHKWRHCTFFSCAYSCAVFLCKNTVRGWLQDRLLPLWRRRLKRRGGCQVSSEGWRTKWATPSGGNENDHCFSSDVYNEGCHVTNTRGAKRQVKDGKMQTPCRTEPHWEIRHHSILLSLPPLLITSVTSGTTSATLEWNSENIEWWMEQYHTVDLHLLEANIHNSLRVNMWRCHP